ncbi:MAG: ABC transporter permease [Candidatus Nanoarchaeia archaeon]
MKLEYFLLAFKSIKNRQLRSYLTIIGVVIGVTALVSLVTLGQGLEDGMTEQFDKFGSNIIWVAPRTVSGFGGPPTGISMFTERDAEVVESLPVVDFTAPFVGESFELEYNREKIQHDVFAPKEGIVKKMLENVDIQVAEGRFIEDGDGSVAFIGWRVHKDMFDKEIPLRASIKIDGEKFRVIGIKEEQGLASEDNQIMIPLTKAQEMVGDPEGITSFSAIIHEGTSLAEAQEKIHRVMERRRGDENFEVTSPTQIADQLGDLLAVVKWVVAAIASISLIVGGLGIMNTMYSSILERTRELGVMKAIGASQKEILSLILVESGLIGLVGGIIGLVIGLALSFLAMFGINASGATRIIIHVDYMLLAFGLAFAFVLGSLSGAMPAWQAAKMQPVDALRYE